VTARVDLPLLKSCLVRARVDVSEAERYSASATLNTLDKLLDGGFIGVEEYLEHIPEGLVPGRRELLAKRKGGGERA